MRRLNNWLAALLVIIVLAVLFTMGCKSSSPPRTLEGTPSPPITGPEDEVVGVWSPPSPVAVPERPVYLIRGWTLEQALADEGQFILVLAHDLALCASDDEEVRDLLADLNAALAARIDHE